MKVLIVSSSNSGNISPFVKEQVDSLMALRIECVFFFIKRKGIRGYLSHYKKFQQFIESEKPDVIHAHYGFSGLFANLQRKVPVITTYHGSDIHQRKNRMLSKISIHLSAQNIYVSQLLKNTAKDEKGNVIPCGVNATIFKPLDQEQCKLELNLNNDCQYALFSSSFSNYVKNSPLASESISYVNSIRSEPIQLLELNGLTRNQVALIINASQFVLLTSFNEGSPQIIKEALASNRPIVSTDVGTVAKMIEGVDGCFLVDSNVQSVSKGIISAIEFSIKQKTTRGREQIESLELNIEQIAQKIIRVYMTAI